jgi:4-amino-4-deoxy-L-arabinose transferase-like glycosyltransferase
MFRSASSSISDSWLAPSLVFLLAVMLFSINLDRAPHPDELHHLLAAQHLFETGRPAIGEGEYWRGILHTYLVAASYAAFGEGLVSARMPSVLFVALVAPILFLWVRREAGVLAAWLTAILFISSPFTVEIAQFSRFYALQVLCFVLGAICVFYALVGTGSWKRRVSLGGLAAALLALCVWLQVTSLVGMVGFALFAAGVIVHYAFFRPGTSSAVRMGLVALLAAGGVVAVAAAVLTDTLELGWEYYRYTQLFNMAHQDEFWFYHIRFLLFYSTLWSLVGLIAVFAVVHKPQLAWFAIIVFSASFLLMSFAGTKNTRYLSFAPPFLAIVWGLGLAYVLPPLRRYLAATSDRFVDTLALPKRLGSIFGAAVAVAVLAVFVMTNPFWLRTATVIADVALPGENPTPEWRAAREPLASWIADADIMITMEDLGALYFFGRADVNFNASKLEELADGERREFGIDFRTGRPTISKPESLERLMQCFRSGFVVSPIARWENRSLISEEVHAVVFKYAEPIELPRESQLYAWGWNRVTSGEPGPAHCAELAKFSGASESFRATAN